MTQGVWSQWTKLGCRGRVGRQISRRLAVRPCSPPPSPSSFARFLSPDRVSPFLSLCPPGRTGWRLPQISWTATHSCKHGARPPLILTPSLCHKLTYDSDRNLAASSRGTNPAGWQISWAVADFTRSIANATIRARQESRFAKISANQEISPA